MQLRSLQLWTLLALLAALLTFGAACGDLEGGDGEDCDPEVEDCEAVDDNNSQPGEYDVTVQDLTFSPKVLTIPAGSTVTWRNTSTEQISIAMTSAPSGADSEAKTFDQVLNEGQTASLILREPGTYTYHDRINTTRAGLQNASIIVE